MRIFNASLLTAVLSAGIINAASAQTDTSDLMSELNAGAKPTKEYVAATFKATRIINGHSIENVGKGVLDFRISHRFGEIDQPKSFFGLDGATTALFLDYGITNWLMVGIGRSTYQKEFEGFAKIKILRQTTDNSMPISLSYMGSMSCQTMDAPILDSGQKYYFSNRLYYTNQLLIARKFNSWLSLQLMPTMVHYNLVPTTAEPNNTYALGVGGRIKLSNRIALTGEYYYRLDGHQLNGYRNELGVGIDIETGGHVFQLLFTNATAMTERAFIGQTTSNFWDGGIHFGFNISRVFTIVRPKEFKGSKW